MGLVLGFLVPGPMELSEEAESRVAWEAPLPVSMLMYNPEPVHSGKLLPFQMCSFPAWCTGICLAHVLVSCCFHRALVKF